MVSARRAMDLVTLPLAPELVVMAGELDGRLHGSEPSQAKKNRLIGPCTRRDSRSASNSAAGLLYCMGVK